MAPTPCSACHAVFGLHLAADRPICGLIEESIEGDPDLRVDVLTAPPVGLTVAPGAEPFYTSHIRGHEGRPFVTAWRLEGGAYIRLLLSDGAIFVVDQFGRHVWGYAPDIPSPRVSEYLLGPVLGLALCCRGVISLHASVASWGDGAVAFAGPEGSGKSTLAACLALAGHDVVTDDLAALAEGDGAILVHRGAPYIRVRRGAIEEEAERRRTGPALVDSPDGEYLDLELPPSSHTRGPAPLACVYWLDVDPTDTADAVAIESMTPQDALVTLSADAWASRLLDPTQRARQFDCLTRLVDQLPIRRLRRGRRASAAATLAAVERDLQETLAPRGLTPKRTSHV